MQSFSIAMDGLMGRGRGAQDAGYTELSDGADQVRDTMPTLLTCLLTASCRFHASEARSLIF